MTQSAVSQHVAALEREAGLPLVDRGTRPVELTEAGARAGPPRGGRSPPARRRRAGARRDRRPAGAAAAARQLPDRAGLVRRRGARPVARRAPATSRSRWSTTTCRDCCRGWRAASSTSRVVYDHARSPATRSADSPGSRCSTTPYRVLLPEGHRLARRRRTPDARDLATSLGRRPRRKRVVPDRPRTPAAGRASSRARCSPPTTTGPCTPSSPPGSASPSCPAWPRRTPHPGWRSASLGADGPVRRIGVAHLPGEPAPAPVRAMTEILRDLTAPHRRSG